MKLTLALLALPLGLAAQAPGPGENVMYMRQGVIAAQEGAPVAGGFIGAAGFLSADMAAAGKPVKGQAVLRAGGDGNQPDASGRQPHPEQNRGRPAPG